VTTKDDAFIYWIEARLQDLGSIWGGSAFKFGIYHRADTHTKPSTHTHIFGETYAWWKKLGNTPEEAFATVHDRLIEVVDAAQIGNIARIEEVNLAPTLKWKVAFLWQDCLQVSATREGKTLRRRDMQVGDRGNPR